MERLIRTLRSRIGTCRLSDSSSPFAILLQRILHDLRTCSNATTGVSPFERLFNRKPVTAFNNFVTCLDSRPILKKGAWRDTSRATPPLLTPRDSESDTSRDEPLASTTVRRRPVAGLLTAPFSGGSSLPFCNAAQVRNQVPTILSKSPTIL